MKIPGGGISNGSVHLRSKEGLEELNKFQNSEKKKRGKYSKKNHVNLPQNNEELSKNSNLFDFPIDETIKMQFKNQFENDPTGSFLSYPGMLNNFPQQNRAGQENFMNVYSQLNSNIRKSFEMLNKEYNRKPNVNEERELFNMFSNTNQRKPAPNIPYLFNNNQIEPDFNNFEKVFNSSQYFNPNASFPAIFAGLPAQGGMNPYFPNNLANNNMQNLQFNNQMVNDSKIPYDPNQKNEENPAFFNTNQFPNWMVGQPGIPNGIFGNNGEFDNNFMKGKGQNYQNNNGQDPTESMKYGQKMENIENNMNFEAYLKNLTRYF